MASPALEGYPFVLAEGRLRNIHIVVSEARDQPMRVGIAFRIWFEPAVK